jgi:multiple sugar transport system ATP-binding protein
MGSRQLITVDTAAGRLKVKAPNDVQASIGDKVGLSFRTEHLILFDNQTDLALKSEWTTGAKEVAVAHG